MARQPITYMTAAVTASPTDDAETVIATLPGVTVTFPSDKVAIQCVIDINWQAATTSVTFKIRRTGIAGTVVATMVETPKAAAELTRGISSIAGVDAPGDMANGAYVLTATCTTAGGASTVNAVAMVANIGS